ncbi:hypothetical protein [Glaciimonas soli]|uniref:DUF4224 domain-containing protein n=1 Tax=Glaciimonas soli TaxID=2590999 RepID=A0A843YQS4_9BURK|nr:hypothetical protein [Glaciimonas soli]MQR02119.1 hypothetical protein [Glaciimonas soli]
MTTTASVIPSLWLTANEIDDLCDGLRRNHDRLAFLKSLGLSVKEKPNGHPLLLRSNVEIVLGGVASQKTGRSRQPGEAVPDRAALVEHLKAKNGKKEKKQSA